MSKTKYIMPMVLIAIVELIIYFITKEITTEPLDFHLLTARYSARVSFALILYLLFWVASTGLREIFSKEKSLIFFKILVAMLMFNHLIHFYFLSMNYWVSGLSLVRVKSVFGLIGYLSMIILPFVLHPKKVLTKKLYRGIHVYLFIISAICLVKYIPRIKKSGSGDLDLLIVVFEVVLTVGLIWNIMGILKESRIARLK